MKYYDPLILFLILFFFKKKIILRFFKDKFYLQKIYLFSILVYSIFFYKQLSALILDIKKRLIKFYVIKSAKILVVSIKNSH